MLPVAETTLYKHTEHVARIRTRYRLLEKGAEFDDGLGLIRIGCGGSKNRSD